jgi:2',3'-cyclic-nucleotide 2'-phosphodiesterase (5'-nucleotidase family)
MKTFNAYRHLVLLSVVTLLFTQCHPTRQSSAIGVPSKAATATDKIEIVFLQINDVYEIDALEKGAVGGLARVATLKKTLLKQNPNTYLVLAGDFLSPSVMGTLKSEGKKIKGKQMVDVLNAIGVDYVTFGNHEFDIDEADLQARIDESHFTWVSANCLHQTNGQLSAFQKNNTSKPFPQTLVVEAHDADGTKARIGLFGVTLPFNKKEYVAYADVFDSAKKSLETLRQTADFTVALTHLDLSDDKKLAEMLPNVPLLMGGHEHYNMYVQTQNGIVAKADANAKTAWVHRILYNTTTKKSTLKSTLVKIDNSIPFDVATQQVVAKWNDIAIKSFKELGFQHDEQVYKTTELLDGREVTIRAGQTNLGTLVAHAAFDASANNPHAAIINSGSIRVDDQLTGTLTQYDIIRTLPFGGKLLDVNMKGSLLRQILDAGATNVGKGGYLQWYNITHTNNIWTIAQQPLNNETTYRIILPEFLLTGGESNMNFLTRTNPEIIAVQEPTNSQDPRNDIRHAVIAYLKKH